MINVEVDHVVGVKSINDTLMDISEEGPTSPILVFLTGTPLVIVDRNDKHVLVTLHQGWDVLSAAS